MAFVLQDLTPRLLLIRVERKIEELTACIKEANDNIAKML